MNLFCQDYNKYNFEQTKLLFVSLSLFLSAEI